MSDWKRLCGKTQTALPDVITKEVTFHTMTDASSVSINETKNWNVWCLVVNNATSPEFKNKKQIHTTKN